MLQHGPTGTSGIPGIGSGRRKAPGCRAAPGGRHSYKQTQNQSDTNEPNRGERTRGELPPQREAQAPELRGQTRGGESGMRASGEAGGSLYRQPHSSATMLGNLRTSSPSVERLMMSWSE